MNEEAIQEALFVDQASFEPETEVEPFVALQRIVVRMLFDPAFVSEVYDRSKVILDPLRIPDSLQKQLISNDRRLWGADRLRRMRALKILMEEFKVSSTLALSECRLLSQLDAFFSSARFHEAVQWRGYMALAFSQYLQDLAQQGVLKSSHFKVVLELESAMARSRRLLREHRRGIALAHERKVSAKESHYVNAVGVLALSLPSGTISTIQHIEKYLFEISLVPSLGLCDDVPRPDPLPPLSAETRQGILLEPKPDGQVAMSEIEDAFCVLLQATEKPRTQKEIAAHLSSQGQDPDRAEGLIEALHGAEILRCLGE